MVKTLHLTQEDLVLILKCENKSARLENVEEIFTIGINRAITMIAEAKPWADLFFYD